MQHSKNLGGGIRPPPPVRLGLENVASQVKDKKANYYSSVYSILHERISKPKEQSKSYLLSLLGDRDYERIVESINKVDKCFVEDAPSTIPQMPDLDPSFPLPPPNFAYPTPTGGRFSGSSPQAHAYLSPYPYFHPRSSEWFRNLRPRGDRPRIVCDYCRIPGHVKNSCYKKAYDANRRKSREKTEGPKHV